MKDEIKEILDRMQELVKHKYDKEIHTYNLFDDIQDLLDYITNLQQENGRLKQPQIFIDSDIEERYGQELYEDYLKEQLEDYKSRCEKTIKYIKKLQEQDDIEIWREDGYWAYVLNILNGGEE